MTSGVRWRRRLQGVTFLVVVALLISLTIAIYNKALPWQAADTVYLQAQTIGNELNVPSDVKYDGVLVGRVSAVDSNGEQAKLTLQLDKSVIDAHSIPENVEAQILPKTLFGEKFVQLVSPSTPTGDLQVGQTIPQDRSKTSLELQDVFDNLVPVLKALNPVQLKETLSSVADTLRGRGNELGQSLVLADRFFKRFNTDLPNLNHDISALATLANNYAEASPDLLAALRNFSVTAQTFAEKQTSYADFLTQSQGLANTATKVIGDNSQRLIDLNRVSRPVTALYARNSIVLECMPNGLAIYDRDRLEGVFGPSSTYPSSPDNSSNPDPNTAAPNGVPAIHIALIPVGDRGTYTTKPTKQEFRDLPDYSKRSTYKGDTQQQYEQAKSRMLCRGLPYANHTLTPHFDKYPTYPQGPSGNYAAGGLSTPSTPSATGAKVPGSTATDSSYGTGGAGSPAEQQTLGQMLSAIDNGRAATDLGLEDLLLGPMLRGMVVEPS